MNGDRPDSHYTETGFPYAASASYMDFYGGAGQEPLSYAHAGTMHHPQVRTYTLSMLALVCMSVESAAYISFLTLPTLRTACTGP